MLKNIKAFLKQKFITESQISLKIIVFEGNTVKKKVNENFWGDEQVYGTGVVMVSQMYTDFRTYHIENIKYVQILYVINAWIKYFLTTDQIANMRWITKKAREFQKNIYFCFIDYAKAFDCVDHNKLWKILREMGIPDHLTCLLRNLYAGQEATVRTGHGATDWFQIGKGVRQGYILSPCLFNLYAEYIMRNAGLEEI